MVPEPLLKLPNVSAVVQVGAGERFAEAMKLPFPTYRVFSAVLLFFLAHVLAVTAIQLGAMGEIFQDTEKVAFHAALAVWEDVLLVSVAALIFLERRYQVVGQGDGAGLAVLGAGTLLGNEQ